MINEIKEIGCWNCALDGVKSGKFVCPDCGTERARHCGLYIHEKIQVEKSEMESGMMIEKIVCAAMLEQMAEESAELAKAALKLARIVRKENPTPVKEEDAIANLYEEYTDVVQCAREFGLIPDEDQILVKEARFKRRWKESHKC